VQIPSWDRPRNLPYALDASFWLYASKDQGPFHFDLNGGFNVWQFDVAPDTQGFVTLATSLALSSRWAALLEVYQFGDGGIVGPRDGGVLSGATYAPVPWLMFDAGVDYGLVRETRSFTIFAGLTTVVWDFWDTREELRQPSASRISAARAATAWRATENLRFVRTGTSAAQ
jgi:hypothetical protein